MLCKRCNKQVSILDERCPHCGNDLTKVDIEKRYIDIQKPKWIIDLENRWCDRSSFAQSFEDEEGDKRGWKEIKLNEIKEMVFANPFVEENQEYRGKTGETTFYYDEENMQINAFVPYKKRKIIFCDGYLNYLFAVETIFKYRFYDKLALLSKTLFDNKFSFSFEEISEVTGYEPDQDIIRNGFISSFETIAHELGHSCLNHIFTLRDNLDVSRILERQADEFAASVIASSCFNDKLFSCHIKSCVAWAVVEKDGGIVEPGTHPLALERLKNAIRNNSELARDLGIDVNWVTKMFG